MTASRLASVHLQTRKGGAGPGSGLYTSPSLHGRVWAGCKRCLQTMVFGSVPQPLQPCHVCFKCAVIWGPKTAAVLVFWSGRTWCKWWKCDLAAWLMFLALLPACRPLPCNRPRWNGRTRRRAGNSLASSNFGYKQSDAISRTLQTTVQTASRLTSNTGFGL